MTLPDFAGWWFDHTRDGDSFKSKPNQEPNVWIRHGFLSHQDEPNCIAARIDKYESRSGVKFAWGVYDCDDSPVERGTADNLFKAMQFCDSWLKLKGVKILKDA